MSLTAAASGFAVFLLSVSVIQGQNDWGVTYSSTKICALKGSTVDMSCTYRYPSTVKRVEKKFWFTKVSNGLYTDLRTDPRYSRRVQYICGNNDCTLRITDLRESDSAEYKFGFITDQEGGKYSGSPGVTLSVTDLQVRVNRLQASTRWAWLMCHSSCRLPGRPRYIWYKNGRIIQGQTSYYYSGSFNPADSFSCTVEGHENSRSPPLYAPKLPSVSVSPSGEIVEGSSVTLTCSSDANPAATYTWYKNNRNADRHPLSKDPQLHFSSIQSSDSGEYYCTAQNELWGRMSKYISIDVTYAPRLPSVSVSPSAEIVEGSSVTLTCSSDANPAAKYTWYKKNGDPDLQPLSKEPQLVFSSIQSSDSGEYYCTAENELGRRTSEYISIDVTYAPQLPSVSVSPSAEIVEGISVNLSCSSDANPAANYTWYKENYKLLQSPEGSYYFTSISSHDGGNYSCKAQNQYGQNSSSLFIDVQYAPKLPSVSVSPSAEIVEGSSVTLTCSSDANPAANYTWYKSNGNADRHPLSKDPQLHFSSIQSSESGEYYCTAENELGRRTSEYISIDVTYAPRLPSVSVSPSAEIVEGSSVTLTCSSDANPAANYTWYKENYKLLQSPEGSYYFTSISSHDGGNYSCKAQNQYGQNSSSLFIDVQYAPKLPSVSVSPSAEIVEGSSVTLTCSSDANPAANYTWYKEDEDSPKASGHIFTITDFRAEHSGNYYCEAQNRRGRHNATLQLIVLRRLWKTAAIGTTPAVILAIVGLALFLLIRKSRAAKQSPQLDPDDRAQEQDDLHYASVHFSKSQTDPVYSNIRPAGYHRHKEGEEEEEEEEVEYAAVKFTSASAAPRSRGPKTVEDPSALYSTVNKQNR